MVPGELPLWPAVPDPTGVREDAGLIPALAPWVGDPALPWAVVEAGSCSSDSPPSLETSMCKQVWLPPKKVTQLFPRCVMSLWLSQTNIFMFALTLKLYVVYLNEHFQVGLFLSRILLAINLVWQGDQAWWAKLVVRAALDGTVLQLYVGLSLWLVTGSSWECGLSPLMFV